MGRLLPAHLTATAPVAAPAPAEKVDLKDDTLYGVEAIREFLGLPKVKQVYRLREHGKAPIFMVAGVGLSARKSSLKAWYDRMEDAANDRAASLAKRRRAP